MIWFWSYSTKTIQIEAFQDGSARFAILAKLNLLVASVIQINKTEMIRNLNENSNYMSVVALNGREVEGFGT